MSCLLPQFKCYPDPFSTQFRTLHSYTITTAHSHSHSHSQSSEFFSLTHYNVFFTLANSAYFNVLALVWIVFISVYLLSSSKLMLFLTLLIEVCYWVSGNFTNGICFTSWDTHFDFVANRLSLGNLVGMPELLPFTLSFICEKNALETNLYSSLNPFE